MEKVHIDSSKLSLAIELALKPTYIYIPLSDKNGNRRKISYIKVRKFKYEDKGKYKRVNKQINLE